MTPIISGNDYVFIQTHKRLIQSVGRAKRLGKKMFGGTGSKTIKMHFKNLRA